MSVANLPHPYIDVKKFITAGRSKLSTGLLAAPYLEQERVGPWITYGLQPFLQKTFPSLPDMGS